MVRVKLRAGSERLLPVALALVIVIGLVYSFVYRPTRLTPDLRCSLTESMTLEEVSGSIDEELRMKHYRLYEMSDISIAMKRISGTELDVVAESVELFSAMERARIAHIMVVMRLPDVAVLSIVDVDRASSAEGWSDVLKYWASPPPHSVISKEPVVRRLIQIDLPEKENAYRIFIVTTGEKIAEDVESIVCEG